MTATVELDGISKSYGATRALDGVSLSIGAGVTGFLGPNGAGKTTLLRMLATVLAPDQGSLRILCEDPGSLEGRLAIRRRLGYFPQEPGYYQNLSAYDFVDYIAILKEHTDRAARRSEVRRARHR
jgi:ABC-2 type transport system ATP-binding protein